MLSRRALMLAAAAAALAGPALGDDRTGRIAIQLYTLRDLLARDLDGGLRALADIGYHQVQPSDRHGRSPAEFRGALDAAGLAAPSAHIAIPQPFEPARWQQMLAEAQVVGHTALVHSYFGRTPLGPIRDRASWQRFAADLDAAGRLAADAGIALEYHNHDAEFLPLDEGSNATGFDVLLAETDPALVGFEIDLYWLWTGAPDPWAILDRAGERVTRYHVKDRTTDGRMADVGQGAIDFARVFALRPVQQYIVERDDAGTAPRRREDALDTARTGFEALTALLG